MRRERPTGAGEDAALLRAVAAGDADALAALYDRHAGWLHARLTRRCRDGELVDEVLQDTFLTVWRSAGHHRGDETGGWLWTLAGRRLADALRRQERAARPLPEPVPPAPSAEDRVLSGLAYGEAGEALGQLPAELGEVLRMTVVEGLSTRETARRLGIPEGTVKSRALRARRHLRTALTTGPGTPGGTP
ncbi:RNA polymerase sigma factor [Streptomyces sp. SPB074]|uniref:RNA polymerase sigma factor n=1 Tax=Streptomyces sp. (strain SPB074) TaxID=465543 RepID=UPI00017F1D84|nr:RNA polymerase sigma factor [Streptomyces sp. SPB074]EDY46587.1 RNA polymerase sigma-70 factor, ECF subfamily [Streptomyces sp. SPB074]